MLIFCSFCCHDINSGDWAIYKGQQFTWLSVLETGKSKGMHGHSLWRGHGDMAKDKQGRAREGAEEARRPLMTTRYQGTGHRCLRKALIPPGELMVS